MISVKDCIKYATDCEEMAKDPSLAEDREAILKIAELWRQIAESQLGVT